MYSKKSSNNKHSNSVDHFGKEGKEIFSDIEYNKKQKNNFFNFNQNFDKKEENGKRVNYQKFSVHSNKHHSNHSDLSNPKVKINK